MTRRQSYGERMAEWEAEQDERNWNRALSNALYTEDYSRIEDLVVEGLISDYDFPSITDKKVLELIQKHKR